MSDKAGSDLDVFDGLAAKKSRPSASPSPGARAPVVAPSSATRQKTLLGLAAPVGPPKSAVPPPPPGSRPTPPPGLPRGSLPPPPPPPPPSKLSAAAGFPTPPPPPPPKTVPATYAAPIPPQQAVFEPPPNLGRSAGGRGLMIGTVVLLLAGVAAGAMFLMPKKGTMFLTVAGPGNKPVDAIEVYVDGTKKCDASPCRVIDLATGSHLVKVTAAGYQPTADQAVKISSGDEAVQNVLLTRASDGTGIRVAAEGRGIKLSVDGKEVGPLPQELKDLSPGEHLVHLDGGERYESFEKRILVEADQMQTVEPKLRVKKGLATIKLGDNAEGAKVLLVSGSERRPLPQLPITVDISVDKPYSIVATKKGFGDFEQRVAFEDGQAERTFVVNLAAGEAPAPASTFNLATSPTPATRAPTAPATTPTPAATPKAASGNGTISMNAIPASNVLLDGKPMGQTPRTGVSVTPGSHTVVFVNSEHGRKAKTVTVDAGKSVSVVVRFP
ncbi:MAG: PEGA domain-containing protein [Polyangiaceae bacterium]